MSATTTGRPRTALGEHLREPMRRAAYALILGTGITSALGLLFWALAARLLPPTTVGIGAALVSAATLLANIATLGLRNGLVRFLPEAGASTRRLILSAYGLCAGAATVVAAVFVLGQPVWAAELWLLRSSPWATAAFCLATAVWVLFILQDHVLTGLHRTVWVPVTNGLSSAAKIGLLPLLAFSAGWAIFAASVLPAAVVVAVVTVLVLRSAPAAEPGARTVPVSRLTRFAAADHLAALLWLGTASVLTLMVLQQLGPAASAYYYMAHTIAYAAFLITSNVSSALVAEGARSPDRTTALIRAAVRNAALLVLPAVAVGVLLAGPVLRVFGAEYAEQATVLLRLLLVSAVPQVVVGVALAAARLRQDLLTVVLTYVALAVTIYGGAWLAIGWWHLNGVGIAYLASQVLVAVGLLVSGRSGVLVRHSPTLPQARGPSGAPRLAPGPLLRRWRSQRELRVRLGPALAACGLPTTTTHRLLTSDSDVLVVALDTSTGPLVLKIATSPAATTGLDRHADVIVGLGSEVTGGPIGHLLPRVLARRTLDEHRVLLETRLPGAVSDDPAVTPVALTAITALHSATACRSLVGPALLQSWVDEPLRHLRRLPARLSDPAGLDALAGSLHQALAEQELCVSTVHGDFWSGNVLVDERHTLTGIIDWEDGQPVGLPDIDLVHWWLTTQPGELGPTVRRALNEPAAVEASLAALPVVRPNPHLGVDTVVLLAWLTHVAGGLARAVRNPLSPVWVLRNVRPVVARFAPPGRDGRSC